MPFLCWKVLLFSVPSWHELVVHGQDIYVLEDGRGMADAWHVASLSIALSDQTGCVSTGHGIS